MMINKNELKSGNAKVEWNGYYWICELTEVGDVLDMTPILDYGKFDRSLTMTKTIDEILEMVNV